MTFDVEIDGRPVRVAVEPVGDSAASGGGFRVVIGETTHIVDARRTELGWSLVYEDDRRSVDAAVTELVRGTVLVQLPRVDVRVGVDGRRFRGDGVDTRRSGGDTGITAPMPGRVVRVLVKPGDRVAARQGLLIVEAMKMENELTAPADGRVAEVLVADGQPVEAGRLLVRLEQEETGFLKT